MSDTERWGNRSLIYSNWHRTHSIQRFIGNEKARELTMIDLDGIEFCHACKQVVGLVESTMDVGQYKPATVTEACAKRLGVPAVVAYYTPSHTETITNGNDGDEKDIDSFRVRVLNSPSKPSSNGKELMLSPAAFARCLSRWHDLCSCRSNDCRSRERP